MTLAGYYSSTYYPRFSYGRLDLDMLYHILAGFIFTVLFIYKPKQHEVDRLREGILILLLPLIGIWITSLSLGKAYLTYCERDPQNELELLGCISLTPGLMSRFAFPFFKTLSALESKSSITQISFILAIGTFILGILMKDIRINIVGYTLAELLVFVTPRKK
jgi:hypothetical protein